MRKALDGTEVVEGVREAEKSGPAPEPRRRSLRPFSIMPLDAYPQRGRPGIYNEHTPELARRLALVGLTDEEMAKVFEVEVRTIYRWDNEHPEFRQARSRAGAFADGAVASRLYHRAVGYSQESVKIFMPAGAEEPVYAPYTEHFPPDTQAATWWLKNRQKDKWKDKSEVDWTGRMEIGPVPYDPESLTTEQREVMRDVLLTAPKTIEGKAE